MKESLTVCTGLAAHEAGSPVLFSAALFFPSYGKAVPITAEQFLGAA